MVCDTGASYRLNYPWVSPGVNELPFLDPPADTIPNIRSFSEWTSVLLITGAQLCDYMANYPTWFTITPAPGIVTSWTGNQGTTRTGPVVAIPGDYAGIQLTNDSSVPGATVKDALDYLLTNGGGGGGGGSAYALQRDADASQNLGREDEWTTVRFETSVYADSAFSYSAGEFTMNEAATRLMVAQVTLKPYDPDSPFGVNGPNHQRLQIRVMRDTGLGYNELSSLSYAYSPNDYADQQSAITVPVLLVGGIGTKIKVEAKAGIGTMDVYTDMNATRVVMWSNAASGGGGGATDFIDLGDVPSSYAGSGGYNVRVNVAENALEFVPASAPGLHASTHKHGGADEVATATPGANEIVKANGSGLIDNGWIGPTLIERSTFGDSSIIESHSAAGFIMKDAKGSAYINVLSNTGSFQVELQLGGLNKTVIGDALGDPIDVNVATTSMADAIVRALGTGKIDESFLPDSIVGQVEYQGTWQASTNTPAIPAPSSANKGWYYICSDSVAIGHGYPNVPNVPFDTGDWIICDGTAWAKVDNTDAVASVFGRLGPVVAAFGDYLASQIDNDSSVSGADVATALNNLLALVNSKLADGDSVSTGLFFRPNALNVEDTGADHFLRINVAEDLSADRTLGIIVLDADAELTVDGTAQVSGNNTGNETTTTVGALVNGATAKTTPVDADLFSLADSAASFIIKKLSWANLKTALNGLYLRVSQDLADLNDTAAARSNLGVAVDFISGHIETAANKSYVLDLYAAYAYTINELKIVSASGTVTAAVTIDAVNVTGISSVSVSSSEATGTASAANSVAVGNTVRLVFTSNSSALDVAFTLKITRA